jgi:hypothetical protein
VCGRDQKDAVQDFPETSVMVDLVSIPRAMTQRMALDVCGRDQKDTVQDFPETSVMVDLVSIPRAITQATYGFRVVFHHSVISVSLVDCRVIKQYILLLIIMRKIALGFECIASLDYLTC